MGKLSAFGNKAPKAFTWLVLKRKKIMFDPGL